MTKTKTKTSQMCISSASIRTNFLACFVDFLVELHLGENHFRDFPSGLSPVHMAAREGQVKKQ